jgi:hypothetical protein
LSDLVRIAPGALAIGKPLPWTVYDSSGNLLLRQGHVIQTNAQLEQLFERGLFKPRVIRKAIEETLEDTRARNPFADYPKLLKSLEVTLTSITDREPNARSLLLDLTRMITRMCEEAPDASLGLIHLYCIEPGFLEQILFYGILCHFIAREFGLSETRSSVLTAAALTANLALVPVADKLNASRKVLSDQQREVIRTHPERSGKALEAAGIDNQLLLRAVLQHHERADGSGYPRRLSGTDILPEAEIIALAERYIAMISRRAYRDRLGIAEARRLINNMADGHLRPAIPRSLLKVLTDYPPGTLVRLANEEIAVVTARPVHLRGPFVKAIINPRGERYNGTFERNCSHPDYNIRQQEEPETMPSMDFGLVWGLR